MSHTETGNKPRSDEEAINFRPSPNFKHMKKYLKSKFEEMNALGASEGHNETDKSLQNPAKEINTLNEKVSTSPIKQQTSAANTSPIKQQTSVANTSPTKQQASATDASLTKQQDSAVTASPTKQQISVANVTPQQTVIQPPLPPNPPPELPLDIKKEVIDDEYEYMNSQSTAALQQIITEYKTDPHDQPSEHCQFSESEEPKLSGSEITMCRNFVRGTCKKGDSCIFAHELIISQLPGVYTFCRNFQNRQCTYARCKFVHATVFEKEHFFRTGYLPPHTIAHLKQSTAPPPPPPPPEEPPVQEVPPTYYPTMDMMNENMRNDTGVNMTDMSAMAGMTDYTSMYQAQMQNFNEMYEAGPSTAAVMPTYPTMTSPVKRSWNETFNSDNSTFGQVNVDIPIAKKCKNCDATEFRYQYHRNKVENMLSSAEEINKKMTSLNAKTERLWTVLLSLFKPQSGAGSLGGIASLFGEKEKGILEQLSYLTSAPSRMSYMSEPDNVNIFGSNANFQHLLAKMFMSSSGQP